MPEIKTQTVINATPEKVWQVLTNFEKQPEWNPFIKSITGEKMVGARLQVFIKPPEGKGMSFYPKVLKFNENREFRWLGKLFVKGLFDGEHYFLLKEVDNNRTEFTHGEIFRGILPHLMKGMLSKTTEGFEMMNEALKKECER